MFKVKHNLAQEIMTEVFRLKTRSFDIRSKSEIQRRNIKTVIYGSETLSSLGLQIWDLIPIEFRNLVHLMHSKVKSSSGLLNNARMVFVKNISIT